METMHYEVIDVEKGESHGKFDTLEQAHSCITFDRLKNWEIWDDTGYCVSYTGVYPG